MKTVSWYLHSFMFGYARLVLVTPDRIQHCLLYSQALKNYGWRRVRCAVVTTETFILVLDN